VDLVVVVVVVAKLVQVVLVELMDIMVEMVLEVLLNVEEAVEELALAVMAVGQAHKLEMVVLL
jgi:hypothetical protein